MVRMIDADALKAAFEEKSSEAVCGVELCKAIIFRINKEPTIDAVPVRHGKWIHEVRYTIDSLHSYQQYRCSECGMTYITNTKYCPNCGADMRGDNSEHE